MTEKKENARLPRATGWLCYDRDCPFCAALALRCQGMANRRGIDVIPLQTPWVGEALGLRPDEPLREMVLLTHDRRRFGGVDAVLHLAHQSILTRPLAALGHIGIVHRGLEYAYAFVAARRTCLGGVCKNSGHALPRNPFLRQIVDGLPLIILPAAAWGTRGIFPAWAFMWTLAGAIFLGAKWLTWRHAIRDGAKPTARRSCGYLLAWPGMNAATFLRTDLRVRIPAIREWTMAAIKTTAGAMLLWGAVRMVPATRPLLIGWTGMLGLIFLLHFGVFHLLSLVWRTCGVPAPPLMQWPLAATSVGEFWSRRWNAAFHELVRRHVFRRSARLGGTTFAVFAVFGLSGLVHDLVISLPAGGGLGLPTGYFLLQGIAVIAERTPAARRHGLGRGLPGWLFAVLCIAGPVGVLFHPPFVHHVMLPFLRAIGAF